MLNLVTSVEHQRNAGVHPRSVDEPSSLGRKLGRYILHWHHTGESPISNREAPVKRGFMAVACNLAIGPA
ncbi:hypothetical protein HAX54_004271, partial [Datura stramonium]|nr:hypothetical protein [Datura stramonium]